MIMHYRPARNGDGIETPGVNMGPVRVRITAQFGNYMVWHVPGSTQWSGVGEQTYGPTHFYVMRTLLLPREDTTGWIAGRAEEIKYVETKSGKWRVARAEAIRIAQDLAAKETRDA